MFTASWLTFQKKQTGFHPKVLCHIWSTCAVGCSLLRLFCGSMPQHGALGGNVGIAPDFGRSHSQIGSVQVSSFHTALTKRLPLRGCGSCMGDQPPLIDPLVIPPFTPEAFAGVCFWLLASFYHYTTSLRLLPMFLASLPVASPSHSPLHFRAESYKKVYGLHAL